MQKRFVEYKGYILPRKAFMMLFNPDIPEKYILDNLSVPNLRYSREHNTFYKVR